MSAHRRAPRSYRGGKRRPTPEPRTEPPVGRPGDPDGPGHFAADLANHYDPSQPRDPHTGQWVADPSNIVSMWDRATAGEKQAGTEWYPMAHQTALALSKRYGVSKEEAAGLLATYSPQTPWGRNQIEAAEALRYGHGVGGKTGAVWFTHDDPTVEDRVGIMATGNTRRLADAVLHGGDFDTLTAGRNKDGSLKPGAPKIRAFYHLIAEGKQTDPNNPRVVIDRHAMSVAYGKRVTEEDYSRMRPGSAKKYKPLVDAYVQAALEISQREGRTISPETVQAVTWLAQQRENAAQKTQVGKTRKALGNKDWDEWTKYASRYLGLDPKTLARVGYSDLSNVDLAYNPHEARDSKGRWTETPGGAVKAAIKDIPALGDFDEDESGRPKPEKSEQVSWEQQFKAQTYATDKTNNEMDWLGYPLDPTNKALQIWSDYQRPGKYGAINKRLRKIPPDEKTLNAAKAMFEEYGVTTTADMTVYRALRHDPKMDWSKILQPGTTFQEDGIVSSTTFGRMAEGWLGLAGKANGEGEDATKITASDVVLEIRVPKGSRIVGGTTDFIETMLPPGTRFKIVSNERVRSPNAINPLNPSNEVGPIVYTHVVAEATLPVESPKGRPTAKVLAAAMRKRGLTIPKWLKDELAEDPDQTAIDPKGAKS